MRRIFAVLVIMAMASALAFATGGGQTGPVTGGPARVTVELFDRGTDGGRSRVDDNVWTRWIKEKVLKDLNIDVTFFPVGRWTEETDLITLMAAGSAPDLCYTYNNNNVSNFRDQGGLVNLAPFVDSLLPDMKKMLGSDPAFAGKDFIMRDALPDGRMFSIPSYRVALAMRNVFMRKDWLDKAGIAVPANLQQFHSALVAFRDNDPGSVGRTNVIPFMTDEDARWNLAEFILSSIQTNLSDRDRFIYNFGGGGARALANPGIKEGVRLMNQWYNEGLIFRDFPLIKQNADDFFNILKSGAAGAFAGNWDLPYRTDYKIIEDLRSNVAGADFVPVNLGLNNREMYDKVGLRMLIPVFSRNQQAAMRYLNWLCIPENYRFIQIGNAGVNHQMVGGVPQLLTRPPNDPWMQNSAMNIDFTMPVNGIEMGSEELNARVIALTYGGFAPEIVVNAYQTSVSRARAAVVVSIPTTQDGIYGQTLRDKADALLAQTITARPADFDRIWDAGYQDWLQSGGRAVLDERTAVASQAGLR